MSIPFILASIHFRVCACVCVCVCVCVFIHHFQTTLRSTTLTPRVAWPRSRSVLRSRKRVSLPRRMTIRTTIEWARNNCRLVQKILAYFVCMLSASFQRARRLLRAFSLFVHIIAYAISVFLFLFLPSRSLSCPPEYYFSHVFSTSSRLVLRYCCLDMCPCRLKKDEPCLFVYRSVCHLRLQLDPFSFEILQNRAISTVYCTNRTSDSEIACRWDRSASVWWHEEIVLRLGDMLYLNSRHYKC